MSSQKESKSKRRLSLPKKVFFSLFILCALLFSLELGCRILGFGKPLEIHEDIANWQTQWKGDFYVFEPSIESGINLDGVRDRQHSLVNPQRNLRIACLGDSVTFGYLLSHEESYPAILEQRLLADGHDVEVFNIALPGWSTRQESHAYERIARKYHPDVVVLGLCLNDIAEMQNNLSRPPWWLATAHHYSYFVRSLIRADAREIAQVEELFESTDAAKIQNAWKLTFDEIKSLAREVKQNRGRFVLVVFPFRLQVDENAPEALPQQKLKSFARDANIDYIDMLPALKEPGREAFADHDHLSRKGADCVVDAIVESGILRLPTKKDEK